MTTDQLFNEIQTIAARKQTFGAQTISVDTLLLALRITEPTLMPLILELEARGDIQYNTSPSTGSHRSHRLGTVQLVDKVKEG
jgi:hypothetical protein